ncbi:MAG: hypothetical protein IKR50_10160 [Prevotella sp.]|nr:hypothetical protein [Prevotella sp.]
MCGKTRKRNKKLEGIYNGGICNLIVQVPPLCNSIRLGYEYIFFIFTPHFFADSQTFRKFAADAAEVRPHAIIGESLPTNSGQMSSLKIKKTSTWKEIKGNT